MRRDDAMTDSRGKPARGPASKTPGRGPSPPGTNPARDGEPAEIPPWRSWAGWKEPLAWLGVAGALSGVVFASRVLEPPPAGATAGSHAPEDCRDPECIPCRNLRKPFSRAYAERLLREAREAGRKAPATPGDQAP